MIPNRAKQRLHIVAIEPIRSLQTRAGSLRLLRHPQHGLLELAELPNTAGVIVRMQRHSDDQLESVLERFAASEKRQKSRAERVRKRVGPMWRRTAAGGPDGEKRSGLRMVGSKVEKVGTSNIGKNKPPRPKAPHQVDERPANGQADAARRRQAPLDVNPER